MKRRLGLLVALALVASLGLTGCAAFLRDGQKQPTASQVDAEVRANLGDGVALVSADKGRNTSTYTYQAPDGIEFTCEAGVGPDGGPIPLSWAPYIQCTYIKLWFQQHSDALFAALVPFSPQSQCSQTATWCDSYIIRYVSLADARKLGPVLAAALNNTRIPLTSQHTWATPTFIIIARTDYTGSGVSILATDDPPIDADALTTSLVQHYTDYCAIHSCNDPDLPSDTPSQDTTSSPK